MSEKKKSSLFLDIFKSNKKSFFDKFDMEDCSLIDTYGHSLLMEALSYSSAKEKVNIAKFLIENECNLNHQDKEGFTALHYVLKSRREDEVVLADMLIDKMDDIDTEDNYGNTPLMEATMNPKVPLKIIEKLLKKGADSYHKNKAGRSPCDMVKEFNIPELTEIFESYV